LAVVAGAAIAAGCQSRADRSHDAAAGSNRTTVSHGGAAIASIRSEPRAFSRLAAPDSSTELVSVLTQSRLVRINRVTLDVEPWLAESWSADADGRRFTIKLRQGVTFSDGHPFTADDVVFTFRAAYDERTASALHDSMLVAGKPLDVAAVDPHTLTLTFPSAFAPGVRILDNLPIFPKHKLEPMLQAGTLAKAWGLSTPPAEIVGLGPFVLKEYAPGQRIVLDRNPRYWRKAADGGALPYLDRLTLEVIRDQNAELLRLTSGQIDFTYTEVPPESYASVKRAAADGIVRLFDLGVSMDPDSFWFNLKPGAFDGDPRAAWLQKDELRRAISMAVDRRRFSDTVFFGAGEPVYLPVTPANKKWYPSDLAPIAHDPAGAKALLASIGLTDRNGDGTLEDAHGQPVRFTLITQAGRPRLERGAAVVKDELAKIGIAMDVATLDPAAVIDAFFVKKKYEAVYFHAAFSDTDPATTPDFWFSSGGQHFWNMSQPKPATDWEKQIDELMARQIATPDERERKRLFAEVLRVFSAHQPVIYFAAPRVYVAVASRVTNVTPAVYVTPVLWDPDTIAIRH